MLDLVNLVYYEFLYEYVIIFSSFCSVMIKLFGKA